MADQKDPIKRAAEAVVNYLQPQAEYDPVEVERIIREHVGDVERAAYIAGSDQAWRAMQQRKSQETIK